MYRGLPFFPARFLTYPTVLALQDRLSVICPWTQRQKAISAVKNLPGRKTDVADATWLAQLGAHGLVRGSFVPPEPVRQLRDLTRARTAITRERSREAQRLEKLLEDAGIKSARQ